MSEILKNNTANPAPLGLLGFGMTTVLLNLHNAGFFELNIMIMTMGIFYGGITQVIAGIFEYKKGNTFGMVAFTSYGAFWLSLVGIWIIPTLGIVPKPDEFSMGCYLFMWGLLTFGLFLGTLKGTLIGKLVFGSLTILFILLALANFTGNHNIHIIAGFEGILCGSFAIYEALAIILNEKYKKIILPIDIKR